MYFTKLKRLHSNRSSKRKIDSLKTSELMSYEISTTILSMFFWPQRIKETTILVWNRPDKYFQFVTDGRCLELQRLSLLLMNIISLLIKFAVGPRAVIWVTKGTFYYCLSVKVMYMDSQLYSYTSGLIFTKHQICFIVFAIDL